ncbi:MAG: tRNA (adenosine(37)-N6)-threonylcarbamoyltransferase complex transferase subunit TsaD [Candidatus Aminicenantes bacterium]|nr:tRNA (adenosine(37)-N6)-threonylcarbamoyltransferase complex transferase subunit TsaD [Candidatus Aminicenantes bacterium]
MDSGRSLVLRGGGTAPGGEADRECETSACVLEGSEIRILSNIVLSQDEIHAPYGGVVPELASRQHLKSIAPVVAESLAQAGLTAADIDAFAVTQGPGLIGSLLVGVSFAKGLAYVFGKPLIGVDHVQAHIEAAFLEHPATPLPALALIVSGGHTSLFLLRERLHLELLGRTRDDAAGEALDKIAKFLDLGYPGGPIIQKLAEPGDPKAFAFVLPRMTDRSLDFSFSGLKTAAIRHVRESGLDKNHPRLPDFLASFEAAVTKALLDNLMRAADRVEPKSLILCGGVARNKRLRTRFEETARSHGLVWAVPSGKLCTDNAAMVGALALTKLAAGEPIPSALELDAYPRRPAAEKFIR